MLWFWLTLAAYALLAAVSIGDKFFVSRAKVRPDAYAAFLGLAGLCALLFIPWFGLPWLPPAAAGLALFAGALFIGGAYFLYLGLTYFEVSRFIPAAGALTAVLVFFGSNWVFDGLSLSAADYLAFSLLLAGGIILVRAHRSSAQREHWEILVAAALFISASLVASKLVYLESGWWAGFLWMRLGAFLAALALLSRPAARRSFRQSLRRSASKTAHGFSGLLFLINQAGGAAAIVLQSLAIFLAPVSYLAFIGALQGAQYAFLLIFVAVISSVYPAWRASEHFVLRGAAAKGLAILLIGGGLFLFAASKFERVPAAVAWGVNFSPKHADNLGLDWRAAYLAILDDLGARKLKIALHWDRLEPQAGEYSFAATDWQFREAEARGAELTPVVGLKTTRWPECHAPEWSRDLGGAARQERIRRYLQAVVVRYRESPALRYWQVENEPFFDFGECPPTDLDFLKEEIALVKRLDPAHPILLTDTGEFSLWLRAGSLGDVVGTTLYRTVWAKPLQRTVNYPSLPAFYEWRAWLVRRIFGKPVINAELQAEPGGRVLYYDLTLAEQFETMTLPQFRSNIHFAAATRLPEAYFWGVEWWYWLYAQNGYPDFWLEAKELFESAEN